ncbi:MAG: hypothetical protein ACTSUE_20235 [Promethearchaeota archaeon]
MKQKPQFNRKFMEVMSGRVLEDLALKVRLMEQRSNDENMNLFFSMCDWGIDMYVQAEKKKYPEKSRELIMKEFYHVRGLKKRRD